MPLGGHKSTASANPMWWQRSIRKTSTSSLIWMNCSLGMKIACGTKRQLYKGNHRLIDLSFVLRFGTGAAAAAVGWAAASSACGRPSPMTSTHERWLSLPADARQDFRRNAERWMRMGPEERKILRERENLLQAQIK